jgi:hypothetical protein
MDRRHVVKVSANLEHCFSFLDQQLHHFGLIRIELGVVESTEVTPVHIETFTGFWLHAHESTLGL